MHGHPALGESRGPRCVHDVHHVERRDLELAAQQFGVRYMPLPERRDVRMAEPTGQHPRLGHHHDRAQRRERLDGEILARQVFQSGHRLQQNAERIDLANEGIGHDQRANTGLAQRVLKFAAAVVAVQRKKQRPGAVDGVLADRPIDAVGHPNADHIALGNAQVHQALGEVERPAPKFSETDALRTADQEILVRMAKRARVEYPVPSLTGIKIPRVAHVVTLLAATSSKEAMWRFQGKGRSAAGPGSR